MKAVNDLLYRWIRGIAKLIWLLHGERFTGCSVPPYLSWDKTKRPLDDISVNDLSRPWLIQATLHPWSFSTFDAYCAVPSLRTFSMFTPAYIKVASIVKNHQGRDLSFRDASVKVTDCPRDVSFARRIVQGLNRPRFASSIGTNRLRDASSKGCIF
jgi:hypothetical protein